MNDEWHMVKIDKVNNKNHRRSPESNHLTKVLNTTLNSTQHTLFFLFSKQGQTRMKTVVSSSTLNYVIGQWWAPLGDRAWSAVRPGSGPGS